MHEAHVSMWSIRHITLTRKQGKKNRTAQTDTAQKLEDALQFESFKKLKCGNVKIGNGVQIE